ncbi:type IV secretion system DNA-binding domain-containing protein [Methylophaga thalassica]|uniref:type IV secretion system DNA-binding domain-containing protein n=1 Tax=Methylophaga thalassica TaxID=40223 RepID=UPI002E7B42B8|nr:type IV secretion system DNA-binding domain-containing protein [Methylophaga thalassica]WVI84923.1 type IV secretion system DNA-binding domain-containing protein [Methylophaga thalassica]
MVINKLAPSVHRQEWGLILSVVAITFLLLNSALIYMTWHIYSAWGSFETHMSIIGYAIKEAIFNQSLQGWQYYWQQISNNGWDIDFVLHVGIPTLISTVLALFAGSLCYYPGGRDRLQHISGPKLYGHKMAIKHAKQQLKLESSQHSKLGLMLHPGITISRVRESGNIFVGGAQGTGKTVFITPLIEQVIIRGERAFIYDEKREFTKLFFDKNSTVLIAPWDERGQAWDISSDAKNATQAELIAEHLVMDSKDPLWSSGAKMILAGLIEILNNTKKNWGWVELAKILSLNEVTMNSLLGKYYPRAARFIAENNKTTHSFFVQLIGSLGWIYTLAQAWPRAYEGGFSMTQWTASPKTKKKVILVQSDKRYKNLGAPIANALIALMTSNILSQINTTDREIWLFLDELANLPRNDSLKEWMSLGRSKGCRIVAGTQSISQIQEIYSERGADSLLNMFSVFVSMRLGAAGETATYTAKAFGERQVERPSNSPGSNGEALINWHRERQALVTASDLIHLPQAGASGVEGYLMIPGWQSVYRLRWPIPKIPARADENCPAAWLKKVAKHAGKNKKLIEANRTPERLKRRGRHAVN